MSTRMALSARSKRPALGWMVKMDHTRVTTFDFIAILGPVAGPTRVPVMRAAANLHWQSS